MKRDNRKVLAAAAAAALFVSAAVYGQTALTFVQAQAKAQQLWPGKAVTAEVHQSGTAAIERWAGYKNVLGVFVPCMTSLGTNWTVTMALPLDCHDPAVMPVPPPVAIPVEPFTVVPDNSPPFVSHEWIIDGPYLVEDRDPFAYIPTLVLSLQSPRVTNARDRLHTAICDLRRAYTEPAAFDQFLLGRGIKLRKACS